MAKRNSLTTIRKLTLRHRKGMATLSSLLCALIVVLGFNLASSSTAMADDRLGSTYSNTADDPDGSPEIDMRDDGYNDEYIFGMTRSIARSSLAPFAKPIFFLLTIPLDLAFLPFAAIGGLF